MYTEHPEVRGSREAEGWEQLLQMLPQVFFFFFFFNHLCCLVLCTTRQLHFGQISNWKTSFSSSCPHWECLSSSLALLSREMCIFGYKETTKLRWYRVYKEVLCFLDRELRRHLNKCITTSGIVTQLSWWGSSHGSSNYPVFWYVMEFDWAAAM